MFLQTSHWLSQSKLGKDQKEQQNERSFWLQNKARETTLNWFANFLRVLYERGTGRPFTPVELAQRPDGALALYVVYKIY